MSKILVTRTFRFEAAHRVLGHAGKCRFLHGHSYLVELTVSSEFLDGLGMVIDFSEVKEKVGKWIDDNLDHNAILNSNDPLCRVWEKDNLVFAGRKPLFLDDNNPTAENIAILIYAVSKHLLCPKVTVENVRGYETNNCWADGEG